MAEEGNNDTTEWYLWLFGGIIALSMLGGALSNVSDFLSLDDQFEVTESESSLGQVGDNELVGSSGIQQGQEIFNNRNEQAGSLVGNLIESIGYRIVSFSIFETVPSYVIISYALSFVSLVFIIYSLFRENEIMEDWDKEIGYIRTKEMNSLWTDIKGVFISDKKNDANESGNDMDSNRPDEMVTELVSADGPVPTESGGNLINPKWQHIESLIESDNENDWRQAVLEADIMLDELLGHIGYRGQTVADKLQSVDSADMQSLEDAWQAHKTRNKVAHQGSDFKLDRNTFMDTMNQFKRVFNEFHYIQKDKAETLKQYLQNK